MAIIEMCNKDAPGAVEHIDKNSAQDIDGNFVDHIYYTRKTYIGKCIQESERNTYHDSDFYMLVWDDEKNEPKNICFASTRGWTYPCYGSSVDATPDILEKYEAWLKKKAEERKYQQRKADILKKRANRKIMGSVAAKWDVPFARLLDLEKLYYFEKALGLFNMRIRSGFKKSLRDQLIKWLKENEPKYPEPFSPKQVHYL